VYLERLQLGVAREQARKDLPLSTLTEAYWKIDLHNLLHFLHVRMEPQAQAEIRQYAQTMGQEIVRPLFPLAWEAFVDYYQQAVQLTRLEQEVIARLAAAGRLPATAEQFLAAQDPSWVALERCREREECREKLLGLGILQPSQSEVHDDD
jgi:thymidylate synthase (FAD)